jgi:hypothetical protein
MILGILFWPWIGEVEIFAGFIFVSFFYCFFGFIFLLLQGTKEVGYC